MFNVQTRVWVNVFRRDRVSSLVFSLCFSINGFSCSFILYNNYYISCFKIEINGAAFANVNFFFFVSCYQISVCNIDDITRLLSSTFERNTSRFTNMHNFSTKQTIYVNIDSVFVWRSFEWLCVRVFVRVCACVCVSEYIITYMVCTVMMSMEVLIKWKT